MSNTIDSTGQMIAKINEILQSKTDAVVNIVNDKLTLSVFAMLEQNLKNVKEINFIIRDTKFVPDREVLSQEFDIAPIDVLYSSYDIVEKNKLQHFAKAKAMHDFIEQYVTVRKVNASIQVGGNVIIIDDDFMIQGSSSLELLEQKHSKKTTINFDTMLNGTMDKTQIVNMREVFHTLWYNPEYTSSYQDELLRSLEFVYKEHAPEFLYYFTLHELFGHQLDDGVERFERDGDKFKKTEIWKALYSFQKDCVVSAIQKLQKYGGCIIADSVGLGKTFEALAIIKYFEIKMDNVLVLTPAKLFDNWDSFRGDYTDSFLKEIFHYKIMFHTDLSRYKGMSRSGQDLKRFDWSNYDLVVIDESHNFRNRNDRYDENDQLIMTRYARLLQDVIKRGRNSTKVLLLSATPVNNSLVDLKNQLSIITRDQDFAFEEEGIPSVDNLLRRSTAIINQWEVEENHSKDQLLSALPADFYKLLELMTISRSRKQITGQYGDKGIGKFPTKNKPDTRNPAIDTQDLLLHFSDANEILEQLTLAVYTPMTYIKREFQHVYIEKYKLTGKRGGKMDFNTQSKGMVILHRFNLFKRLESSVFSFAETLRRLLERIDKTIETVEQGGYSLLESEASTDFDDDEATYLEGKYEIDVSHLRTRDFLTDLEGDRFLIQQVYQDALTILEQSRDAKIRELKEIVAHKVSTTPHNAGNRKVIIFTAFADTANYIYSQIAEELKQQNLYTACVTGGGVKTTNKNIASEFNAVLCAFSPMSKTKKETPPEKQVDILIGTDCISEGQNLQDCDTVINFDIQWNPVSLIQRFGRIDRIGSTNDCIQMINFFPNVELNEYLGLEQRVKGKMTTLNIVSTGDEDFLTPEMNDFNFRKRQLERLKTEVVDIDDASENISLADLNMNEYLYELSSYREAHKELTKLPTGIYSVTDGADKGVLLCFKHRELTEKPKTDSSLDPYYLIYMGNDGEVLYGNAQARQALKVFRKLCYGKTEPVRACFDTFLRKTKNTQDMHIYSDLLNKAVNAIKGNKTAVAAANVFDFSGFNNTHANDTADDFELISFLVIE